MSTIVCQNLVSCFDSNLTEATATLKLKVAPPPPPPASEQRNQKSGNWGLYQTEKYSDDKDNYYTKNSSFSKLSPKSLELCTENLGSETGVDNISDCSSIFSSSPPFSPTGEDLITPHKTIELDDWIQKPRNTYNHRELGPFRKATNFPPPLTSSNSLVRHHREGGRLIIEAVEAPFRNTYLQAERSDGRLKLCFFTSFDAAEPTATGEEEEEEEECGGAEEEIEEVDGEMNMEVGKDKYQRLSRCNEGSHGSKGGLCSNWKTALWVATS